MVNQGVNLIENYLNSIQKQFEYYQILGQKTIDQLNDEQLFWQPDGHSNSLAIIVNHLNGNMLSRWTDFLGSDGEKEWRKRDSEFESTIKTRSQLQAKWDQGWNCLFQALGEVNSSNFDQQIFIRNQSHSIQEAINRQLCHYAYHVGQMVIMGKIQLGETWNSLSIPKGKSADFNAEKMSKGRHDGHFTDEIK